MNAAIPEEEPVDQICLVVPHGSPQGCVPGGRQGRGEPPVGRPSRRAPDVTEQERARCPVCRDPGSIINLRTWRAELEARMAESCEAATRRDAAPATGRPREGGSGSGNGSLDPPLVTAEEALLGLAGFGLLAVWRKLVWNPFKDRALPALARRQGEVMQQFSASIKRHPDLWLCQRDKVVFRAGGVQTVPMGEAMTWLRNGDDARLDAALYQG